jgi:cell division protein FtsZ
VIDDTLGDEVRVTVIAAGFDGGEPAVKKADSRRTNFVDAAVPGATAPIEAEVPQPTAWNAEPTLVHTAPLDRGSFDDDDGDLDIPDFLK